MDVSASDALDVLRNGYRVYLEDGKSGFRWEKIVVQSAMQKRIMDVVFKKTQKDRLRRQEY
jgi:hypothetical protein